MTSRLLAISKAAIEKITLSLTTTLAAEQPLLELQAEKGLVYSPLVSFNDLLKSGNEEAVSEAIATFAHEQFAQNIHVYVRVYNATRFDNLEDDSIDDLVKEANSRYNHGELYVMINWSGKLKVWGVEESIRLTIDRHLVYHKFDDNEDFPTFCLSLDTINRFNPIWLNNVTLTELKSYIDNNCPFLFFDRHNNLIKKFSLL